MIRINRKRLTIFIALIVLSASSILVAPCLRKVIASESFTSYSPSKTFESLAQALPDPAPSSQVVALTASPFYLQQDFWGKVAIAVISAILTLTVNYILQTLRKKEEPKQQLSYYTSIRKGIIEVEKDF